jgi:hypothetical protein
MSNTPNKGYNLQDVGENPGTWGTVLNNEMISYVDLNLGGVVTKSLSSSNVTLSASESRNAILRLTGTLLANVVVTTQCRGFFFVENLTSGNFTVTVRNNAIATGSVVPRSTRATLISDETSGVRIASSDEGFVSGTSMLFLQAAAPTGWTKSTTHNNKALRIVSGTGGTSGGTSPFTTVFDNRTLTRSNLPNVTITTSQDGAHNHDVPIRFLNARITDAGASVLVTPTSLSSGTVNETTDSVGNHTHSFNLNGGVTQTSINFDVQYVDAIICEKN